jgi:oxygen-independent coproporphyrinogen-3 oxidase
VTRDDYIGLGAGAGSHLEGVFYFNTFSVPEYIAAANGRDLPVALQAGLSPAMQDFYWLYWRLYETFVPGPELRQHFGNDARIRWMFRLGKALGMLVEQDGGYSLTERGAFWIHLMQNHYILNYVDKVWSRAMKTPWPGRIEL